MFWKILLILVLISAATAVVVAVLRQHEAQERRRRQRRFELPETERRVPLMDAAAERAGPARSPEQRAELVAYLARAGDSSVTMRGVELPKARFVSTPDGEMLLTDPPFKLRPSLFTDRAGRYATAISRRVPPWVVICPRVRLDTLLSPTAPDGRDAEDWRSWRRRVRVRSVDLLLVDRRSWSPLVAIVFHREADARRLDRGGQGGRDMMIDEVLRHVGLPVVVATGRMAEDWPAVRPWIEQALIEGPAGAEKVGRNGTAAEHERGGAGAGGPGWDASAAVALLGLDDEDEGLGEAERGDE